MGGMKTMTVLTLTVCLLLASAVSPALGEESGGPLLFPAGENDALETGAIAEARAQAWAEYRREALADETLQAETAAQALEWDGAVMRYFIVTVGEKPENGYPLYIALHGGGGSDTPDINDQQWAMMQEYYSSALECGVYVAPRGVRDTWDTHFNPESYPLYDRLIQELILTAEADPNRVYLEGFSAGGDGVYAIAPRMADRFAAANMSSGHPNGVNMLNMKNLPIQLQAGEYDRAYNRNTVTAEYHILLDELQAAYGGYEHRTLIHYNCGHNYKDYKTEELPVLADPQAWLERGDRAILRVNSFPPAYLDQFTRCPLPEEVIWDLSTRAPERTVESFYYLSAPAATNQGTVWAAYDKAENRVTLRAEGLNGDFSVLLNEQMVDFDRPILFEANGRIIEAKVTPSRSVLARTTAERGDPNYQFEAQISWAELTKQP